MPKLIGILGIIAGILAGTFAVTGWGRVQAQPPATFNRVLTPLGHEQPDGGTIENIRGWNLYDAPGCPIATAYGKLQSYVGPPVGSFTGKSQEFLFSRIICVPSNGPDYQAMLDDVGRQLLLLRGMTPQPGSEPDPVVHRWLLEAAQTGYDVDQIAGRVISPVLCTNDTPRTCTQYLDKVVLSWTQGPNAVANALPAGCLLNDACDLALTKQVASSESRSVSIPLLAVALLLILAGSVLMILNARPTGSSRGMGTA